MEDTKIIRTESQKKDRHDIGIEIEPGGHLSWAAVRDENATYGTEYRASLFALRACVDAGLRIDFTLD